MTKLDLLRVAAGEAEALEARLRNDGDAGARVFPEAFAAGGCNVRFDLSHVEHLVRD